MISHSSRDYLSITKDINEYEHLFENLVQETTRHSYENSKKIEFETNLVFELRRQLDNTRSAIAQKEDQQHYLQEEIYRAKRYLEEIYLQEHRLPQESIQTGNQITELRNVISLISHEVKLEHDQKIMTQQQLH